MILIDVNLLIHAYNSRSPRHQAAREWWEGMLCGPYPVALAWITILDFIRIMTNPRLQDAPMAVGEAVQRVREWLAHPRVRVLGPSEHHAEILFRALEQLGTAGDLTTDAHLAALAIEYQAEVASADVDFSRFPGLRWFNPLAVRNRR
jgi:toxin-antitoxin system PIN domain toxin